MNAPTPSLDLPRDRAGVAAEARRLVGELYKQVALVKETAETSTDPVTVAELFALSTNLRFAAQLLFSYQAGLAVVEPDPLTGCFLVERIAVTTSLPPVNETVLIWSDDAGDRELWMGHFDGLSWWYVDSEPARHVTHWALRPGVGA